ncbi:hypothetical protein FGG08_004336 [Glutinoglossum americanum]|uniref:Transcription initiation factor TFIID subunit 2 n=1 Tax=Glutinoglossum americanum TaxID=1670608 RepID=A0A9P8KZN1_9PEZI|nr:hypothetical protein FGG08_004336 [Glutinoglossum americanum]
MEQPAPTLPGLGFSVLHQKVELDIDLASKSLKGKTEILISPHYRELKKIRLNCRQCSLKRLNINGRAPTLSYHEPYSKARIHPTANVHQHHMLRQKLAPQLREPPEEELVLTLPKSVRIEEVDLFAVDAGHILSSRVNGVAKRDSGDAASVAATPAPRMDDQAGKFKPLTVYIEFAISKIRDGLHFVGSEEGDQRYPHAFTRNFSFPGSACCLFPCVDDFSTRCTWEITIKCPRTLGDAVSHLANGPDQQSLGGLSNGHVDGLMPDEGFAQDMSGLSKEEKALDMTVVCSGDLTDEIVDPLDPTKKVFSFVCSAAIVAQHIGFAIGPFDHVDLSEFRETDEDDKLGQNAIHIHGFCLPGRAEEVRNTCMPMAKAIDFFTLTYGSFPFSSYKICFVDDQPQETVETASLSICNNNLLFPEDIIEPLNIVTRRLVHALARQWIGINIIGKEPRDMWVLVGIAYFITDMFMKRLSGNNEYRFRQKQAADRVCELDVVRPSLYDMGGLIFLDPSELEFIELKAPLVLFILDRRLAKAGGSSGLSRIISRILLNGKVGDLPNGALETRHFIRTCEKLGHTKLEVFFQQWVFGTGCPRFVVTQRFNKKKLVVEMMINQGALPIPTTRDVKSDTFLRDAKEQDHDVHPGPVPPAFAGPMTIRIHEADGTPYEHIVDIKDVITRVDIPYNTKYKRLKRSRRQKERAAAAAGIDISADTQDDVLLYCLGDVLQSEEEVSDWRLVDWSKEEEEKMNQESFEWIRMDADFEWICHMTIGMPGYMFVSQLQQDRDVVAQLESIRHISAIEESALISAVLVRTLMDKRYFHGIRIAAAHALVKCSKENLDWIGLRHLEKAFQEFFCFPGSAMTRSNDFSDRTDYYIQCAIPQAMAKVRGNDGKAPMRVKRFLFDQLKFNDNSNNDYSDCHYIATLMLALSESLITSGHKDLYNFTFDEDEREESQFQKEAIEEIERYQQLDEWIHSHHNIYSITALDCKRRLQQGKVIQTNVVDFMRYTREGTFSLLRLNAFSNLVELGMLRVDSILQYFLYVLHTDPSPFIRLSLLRLFSKGLGSIAIGEGLAKTSEKQHDGLIIVQEGGATDSRKQEIARTQTTSGALQALRKELNRNQALQRALWSAVTSPELGILELRELLGICGLLYEPKTSLIVELSYPRKWKAEHMGKGRIRFYQSDKIRTVPMKPFGYDVKIKEDDEPPASVGVIKLISKPNKPPPKLKLKLKLPGGTAG